MRRLLILLTLLLFLAGCGTVVYLEGLRVEFPERDAITVTPSRTPSPEPSPSPSPEGLSASTNVNANLRRGASTSFAVVRVLPAGTQVLLVARTSNNAWVQTNEGYWLSAALLTISGDINSLDTDPIPTREGG